MVCDEFVDHAVELARVHSFETLGRSDIGWLAAAGDHLREDFFSLGGGELTAGLHVDQGGERLRRELADAVGKVVVQMHHHTTSVGAGFDCRQREPGVASIHNERRLGRHNVCSCG